MQYFADCSDAAWAEFLRHEEITDVADLDGITRALWAVELPDVVLGEPDLEFAILTGGTSTYGPCQNEARKLREAGHIGLNAPCAALVNQEAQPWRVDGGLIPAATREAKTVVLFGRRPDLEGWKLAHHARPHSELLPRVNPLSR